MSGLELGGLAGSLSSGFLADYLTRRNTTGKGNVGIRVQVPAPLGRAFLDLACQAGAPRQPRFPQGVPGVSHSPHTPKEASKYPRQHQGLGRRQDGQQYLRRPAGQLLHASCMRGLRG